MSFELIKQKSNCSAAATSHMLGEKNDRALEEWSILPIVKQRNGSIMLWNCLAARAQEILCGWREE